jgi:hypothetical protein
MDFVVVHTKINKKSYRHFIFVMLGPWGKPTNLRPEIIKPDSVTD